MAAVTVKSCVHANCNTLTTTHDTHKCNSSESSWLLLAPPDSCCLMLGPPNSSCLILSPPGSCCLTLIQPVPSVFDWSFVIEERLDYMGP